MKPQLIDAHDSLFHLMNHPNLPSYLESMLVIKAAKSERERERERERDGFHHLAAFSLFCCLVFSSTFFSLKQQGSPLNFAVWPPQPSPWINEMVFILWPFGCCPWLFSHLVAYLLIGREVEELIWVVWLSLSFFDVDLGCIIIMYVKRLILEKEQGRKKISGTIWVERNVDRGRKIVKA